MVATWKLLFDLFHHPLPLVRVLSLRLYITRCCCCRCRTSVLLVPKAWYLLLYLLLQPLLPSPALPVVLGLYYIHISSTKKRLQQQRRLTNKYFEKTKLKGGLTELELELPER